MSDPTVTRICPQCGSPTPAAGMYCASCSAFIEWDGDKTRISVQGIAAEEVSEVTRQLSESLVAEREVKRLRSPWVSGSFYLAAAVVIVALLLVVGQVLTFWALPLVIVGAVVLVAVVGAMQLRQDDRLSERGFLKLMGDALRRLPLLFAKRRTGEADDRG